MCAFLASVGAKVFEPSYDKTYHKACVRLYAYKTDSLSVTQKQGIITCIPKPNKSRHFLKNWRPISLLNVIYKLASSVIANRIKPVLDSIVHEDQKGFIAGRFIGENV